MIVPPRRSATNLELSMEGYPAEWPNVGPFQESLSHCPFVEDATKAFLECRSRKSPWPSGPQEDSSSSLPLPPPPPPPPTFTLGLSEHLPQLPSEHQYCIARPPPSRRRNATFASASQVSRACALLLAPTASNPRRKAVGGRWRIETKSILRQGQDW